MKDVWNRLAQTAKPIVLYGMGNGADKILSVFSSKGIEASGVFASDGFARGNDFRGFKVESYSQICERLGDFIVVMSFASSRAEVLENVSRIAAEREFYIPDVPVTGGGLFDLEFVKNHADELRAAYNLLADERSREVFELCVEAKLTGRLEPMLKSADDEERVWQSVLRPDRYRGYVDCGAYTGDTVRQILGYSPIGRIFALEPDRRSYAKLCACLEGLSIPHRAEQAAAWDREDILSFDDGAGRGAGLSQQGKKQVAAMTVDSLVGEGEVDYIKYDVEGAEFEALCGSESVISRCRPDLRVALYHRPEDLFRLVQKVHEMLPDHKLYLRRQLGVPTWDIDLFAVGE
ncbi:MAG: FkbM family methyltransferase [Clostridia bacterium]|nr:FkbM family methyltransferase [Clostridia bacterium]